MKLKLFIPAILIIIISACSPSYMANSDYDSAVNLRNFQTFSLSDEYKNKSDSDPILNNEFNMERIKTAIRRELTVKGYTEVEEDPQMVIKFYTRVKDRQQVQNMGTGFGPYNRNFVKNYEESTTIVDISDAQTKKLIWQGYVSGEVSNSRNNREAVITEKIRRIFRDYPSRVANQK